MKMSSDLVDALPYIDYEFNNPEIRTIVAQMIEDETKRYKMTKNYLETLPNLPELNLHKFETDIMKKEFERLSKGQPMEQLNMKRYELPSPNTNKLNDLKAWQECLDNSYAQLEHQSIRITNLELMNVYGTEAWKRYIMFLTKLVDKSKQQLDKLQKTIQDINLSRKSAQLAAGDKMKILEETWVSLVSKNYEIERACLQLELQIQKLDDESKKIKQ